MAKSSLPHELNRIKSALSQFPDGATPAELLRATGLTITERTMARRLDALIAQGEVIVRGKARATRYFLVQPTPVPNETMTGETTEKSLVPLSREGRSVLEKVTRPEPKRTPVSYHREFLESYAPNITQYLSAADKKKLAATGRTPQPEYPAGTYAKQIMNRLLIDLSWNSSRLEGNTYSLLDTERLIAAGVTANDKSAMDAQMILNHKDAIEFIVNGAADIEFNRYAILSLHALLSDNLLPDPSASGRLRHQPVGIAKSVYTPLAIPQLIEEMFALLLDKARQIEDPFEQSFFVMVHLPYLQPFDDVNKRVSRLAANIPLVKHNLAPLSFIDVPRDLYVNGQLGVYELNRVELLRDVYLWTYERSALRYTAIRQSIGEPDPFKLKYRQDLRHVIGEIVKNGYDVKTASEYIAEYARRIDDGDRPKFSEAVQTELIALHDGNFARYYISPGEFAQWKKAWDNAGDRK
jgi:hypothetical protein